MKRQGCGLWGTDGRMSEIAICGALIAEASPFWGPDLLVPPNYSKLGRLGTGRPLTTPPVKVAHRASKSPKRGGLSSICEHAADSGRTVIVREPSGLPSRSRIPRSRFPSAFPRRTIPGGWMLEHNGRAASCGRRSKKKTITLSRSLIILRLFSAFLRPHRLRLWGPAVEDGRCRRHGRLIPRQIG